MKIQWKPKIWVWKMLYEHRLGNVYHKNNTPNQISSISDLWPTTRFVKISQNQIKNRLGSQVLLAIVTFAGVNPLEPRISLKSVLLFGLNRVSYHQPYCFFFLKARRLLSKEFNNLKTDKFLISWLPKQPLVLHHNITK